MGSRGLAFSDVHGGGAYRLHADGQVSTLFPHRRGIGGMALHERDGMVVGGRNIAFKPFDGGATAVLLERDPENGNVGYNDLATDAAGRIYVGSLGSPVFEAGEQIAGNLYLIDLDGSSRIVGEDVLLTNGLGFSPDGRTSLPLGFQTPSGLPLCSCAGRRLGREAPVRAHPRRRPGRAGRCRGRLGMGGGSRRRRGERFRARRHPAQGSRRADANGYKRLLRWRRPARPLRCNGIGLAPRATAKGSVSRSRRCRWAARACRPRRFAYDPSRPSRIPLKYRRRTPWT